jgi:hypothetical protein
MARCAAFRHAISHEGEPRKNQGSVADTPSYLNDGLLLHEVSLNPDLLLGGFWLRAGLAEAEISAALKQCDSHF